MNKTFSILLAALALLAAACGNTKAREMGEKFATQFAQQWNLNNPDSAQACVEAYNAMCDSAGSKSSFDSGFIAEFGNNDTLAIAAALITSTDEDFASQQADNIVQALLDKTITPDQAKQRVAIVQATTSALNREQAQKAWEKAVDEKVNDLSTSKQMQVFATAVTPQELGAALAAEAKQPNADLKHIDEQIDALRDIYSPQDFQLFNETYNSSLK